MYNHISSHFSIHGIFMRDLDEILKEMLKLRVKISSKKPKLNYHDHHFLVIQWLSS